MRSRSPRPRMGASGALRWSVSKRRLLRPGLAVITRDGSNHGFVLDGEGEGSKEGRGECHKSRAEISSRPTTPSSGVSHRRIAATAPHAQTTFLCPTHSSSTHSIMDQTCFQLRRHRRSSMTSISRKTRSGWLQESSSGCPFVHGAGLGPMMLTVEFLAFGRQELRFGHAIQPHFVSTDANLPLLLLLRAAC